eukprot:13478172-Heterocapsa_arctica.AAC.1
MGDPGVLAVAVGALPSQERGPVAMQVMSAQRDTKHAVRAGEGTNVGELRVLVQDGHKGPRRH